MSSQHAAIPLVSFATFGELLKYLRRRARLTQKDLALAVGYNHAQISRLEKNQRLPDLSTLAALFVPALELNDEPALIGRLLELAADARHESLAGRTITFSHAQRGSTARVDSLGSIPLSPLHEIPRTHALSRLRERLASERRVALCGMAGAGKTTLAAALAREFAQHAPVFWHTFSVGVSTPLEMLIRQLALFLLSLGRAQAASLLQPRSQYQKALSYEQQLHLISAGLNDDQSTPLLCFDNLHLVVHDAPLLHMLNYLSGTTTAALLLTSREQIPLVQVATMSLAGLNPAEGLELIKQLGARGNRPLPKDWRKKRAATRCCCAWRSDSCATRAPRRLNANALSIGLKASRRSPRICSTASCFTSKRPHGSCSHCYPSFAIRSICMTSCSLS